jgi:hypothetical protein
MNIRIYRPVRDSSGLRKYPYKWDQTSKKYRYKYDHGKRHIEYDERQLQSARALLSRTRLINYFQPQVYSYLIDEFYDDRCFLVHGDISGRNFKADALGAMWCLYAVMDQIRKRLSASKSGASIIKE